MSNDFLPKTEDDLVKWATHFVTVATANATAAGLNVANIQTFSTKVTELSTKRQVAEDKRTAAKAATIDKDTTLRVVENTAREFNRTVQGKTGVPDSLKEDLGLKVREKPMPLKPHVPAKLTVVGYDINSNEVRWEPGGNKSGVTYEVFAQFDGKGEFVMIGSTQARKFLHTPVQTGRYVQYMVRARRRDVVSLFTAAVSIYAPTSTNPLTLEKAA